MLDTENVLHTVKTMNWSFNIFYDTFIKRKERHGVARRYKPVFTFYSWNQSYERHLVLKKPKLVLNSFKVCYFNLDHNNMLK